MVMLEILCVKAECATYLFPHAWWVRQLPQEWQIRGLILACALRIFLGQVIPVTEDFSGSGHTSDLKLGTPVATL